ncbi:universal stress protein [Egibacter rhizosphaerae]|uniref:Universal stress protein n=1 Tax=Egibacter rhizosphaerae TaxID=1670831 RepID=A0A411YDY6_9ACTN|nr:universal stress protein [Egibacter rhizosphaerae]QBI19411.1 universal stress protein [Egibacter rhizosphaerae]
MSIVLGYAESPQGLAALDEAAAEAQLRDARLHIVRYVGHDSGDSPTRLREEHAEAEEIEKRLEALREQLVERSVEVSVEVRHGLRQGVSEALLDTADREGAKLVVIGMRRRSPVGKVVMGSVVQDVLLGADCPVLAVKAPDS